MKWFFDNPYAEYSSLFSWLFVIILSTIESKRVKRQMGLNNYQARLFDKLGLESRMQIILAICLPVLLAIVVASLAGQQISVALANGYSSSAFFGGCSALWNIWKAYSSYKYALCNTTNSFRHELLKDVHYKIMFTFCLALPSVLVGIFLFFAYNVGPLISPSWWIIGFVLTIFTLQAISLATNVVVVAEKYESDQLHGCLIESN